MSPGGKALTAVPLRLLIVITKKLGAPSDVQPLASQTKSPMPSSCSTVGSLASECTVVVPPLPTRVKLPLRLSEPTVVARSTGVPKTSNVPSSNVSVPANVEPEVR